MQGVYHKIECAFLLHETRCGILDGTYICEYMIFLFAIKLHRCGSLED